MVAERQNSWPSPRADILKLFRLVPARWVRGGFEHTRLFPSGTLRFLWWERLLAFLAGEGRLDPTPPTSAFQPGRHHACDLLVVGGGPAGIAAANHAAEAGRTVVLATRGESLARGATAMGEIVTPTNPSVTVLTSHEVGALYRGGTLVVAGPHDGGPATAIACAQLVLATGKRSLPPLVPGNALPGMMDATTALALAARGPKALGLTLVVGTDARDRVAARLRAQGVDIVGCRPVAELRAVYGRNGVTGADCSGERIACASIVHAGPWRTDPNLAFQAGSAGELRLAVAEPAAQVTLAGFAAEPDEAVHWSGIADEATDVCPCMDVTAAEIADLVRGGITHVEELKRQSACGMGPCQGFPCWELMNAVRAGVGGPHLAADRPTHRGPRRALTVAQAAGLSDVVEPLR